MKKMRGFVIQLETGKYLNFGEVNAHSDEDRLDYYEETELLYADIYRGTQPIKEGDEYNVYPDPSNPKEKKRLKVKKLVKVSMTFHV